MYEPSEWWELIHRLAVLTAHLLKWRFQPELRGNRWRNTIAVQRFDVKELLEENPSLAASLNERMEKAYQKGVMLAVRETGLSKMIFPVACLFGVEQLLNEEHWLEQSNDLYLPHIAFIFLPDWFFLSLYLKIYAKNFTSICFSLYSCISWCETS